MIQIIVIIIHVLQMKLIIYYDREYWKLWTHFDFYTSPIGGGTKTIIITDRIKNWRDIMSGFGGFEST